MDFIAREEVNKMTILEAQELVQNEKAIIVGCPDPQVSIAMAKIVRSLKAGWQLVRVSDLTEGLEDLARQGLLIIDDNKADGWMAALEQIAALIKDCLKEGVNNDD